MKKMIKKLRNKRETIDFLFLLSFLFCILKITHIVDWNWWIAVIPIWIFLGMVCAYSDY